MLLYRVLDASSWFHLHLHSLSLSLSFSFYYDSKSRLCSLRFDRTIIFLIHNFSRKKNLLHSQNNKVSKSHSYDGRKKKKFSTRLQISQRKKKFRWCHILIHGPKAIRRRTSISTNKCFTCNKALGSFFFYVFFFRQPSAGRKWSQASFIAMRPQRKTLREREREKDRGRGGFVRVIRACRLFSPLRSVWKNV